MPANQPTADDTEMCDACEGSGFGVADTYCGKCGGAGGYPAIADTHPKDGDDFSAPLMSGGGAESNRPNLGLQSPDNSKD